jgi:hypothetical protein
MAASWYPFAPDLPRKVDNSAVRLPDGSWRVDANSRVIGVVSDRVASTMARGEFELTVAATPELNHQTGPARLVSVGRSPYDPSFMIGIDRDSVVLYVACGDPPDVDAEWRVPAASGLVAVNVRLQPQVPGHAVLVRVNGLKAGDLGNRCPPGTSPRPPNFDAPWALGNVFSGHRPFAGRIHRLEMHEDGETLDLLEEVRWAAPPTYWLWPERLYQPSSDPTIEALAGAWHFAGFAALTYFMCAAWRAPSSIPHLAVVSGFAVVLNGGKFFVADRHPSTTDLLFNLAGTIAGAYAGRALRADNGRKQRSRLWPR